MEADYELIRSNRRSIALQLLPDGRLRVRCPMAMPRQQIESFVQSKAAWIEKYRRQLPSQSEKLTAQQLEALRKQLRRQIGQRVAYYAPLVGVSWGKITLRAQRTRWGSCSSRGNLNFNLLLGLVPPRVLDYVVVHELCHRLEMNHSPRFWAQVERILPDYRQCRSWLKENGPALMAKLP